MGLESGMAQEDLRSPEYHSPIVHERVRPEPPGAPFMLTVAILAAALSAWLIWLATRVDAPVGAERAVQEDATLVSLLIELASLDVARYAAALATGLGAMGLAVALRRLFHRDWIAVLAMVVVALDPYLVTVGHLAIPHGFVFAAATWSLALFLMPKVGHHWAGGTVLAVGILFEPILILWGVPLIVIAMVRGHVYAAPIHLVVASMQTLVIPGAMLGVVALMRAGADATVAHCLSPAMLDMMLLRIVPDLGGRVIISSPALWPGGLLAILGLGGTAVYHVASKFRLGRLPGRLQLRLPTSMKPLYARSMWLLFLAILAPHPLIALGLAAAGLALGIGQLAEDAPGFGLALAGALVAFAVLWLVRTWQLVEGTATAEDIEKFTDYFPWASRTSC